MGKEDALRGCVYWLVEPCDGKRIPRLVKSTHHQGAQALAITHRLSPAALGLLFLYFSVNRASRSAAVSMSCWLLTTSTNFLRPLGLPIIRTPTSLFSRKNSLR